MTKAAGMVRLPIHTVSIAVKCQSFRKRILFASTS